MLAEVIKNFGKHLKRLPQHRYTNIGRPTTSFDNNRKIIKYSSSCPLTRKSTSMAATLTFSFAKVLMLFFTSCTSHCNKPTSTFYLKTSAVTPRIWMVRLPWKSFIRSDCRAVHPIICTPSIVPSQAEEQAIFCWKYKFATQNLRNTNRIILMQRSWCFFSKSN